MKYEYNGNLLEEERIDLVADEIINKYPTVKLGKAKEAAMLEGKISSDKNIDDELNRLYNIMLVNSENKDIVITVFKDYLETIKKYNFQEFNIFIKIIFGINKYIWNNSEFPFLSDYQ